MASVPILYAFLEDNAFRTPQALNLNNDYDQGYGILQGEEYNYFVNKAQIADIRHNRLKIVDGTKEARGQMRILFDQDRAPTSMLSHMTDIEFVLFFNILERIVLHQNFDDSQIETILTTSTNFRGYVPHSLTHGSDFEEVKIFTPIANSIRDGVNIRIADWYGFEFSSENVHCVVHIWVSNKSFKTNYPYTTLTAVMPPYEPTILVDPDTLFQSGNIRVLTTGARYIFDQTNLEMAAKDQNGVYIYSTKYVINSANVFQLPFALPYCGPRVPTGLECRRAIRAYLERETNLSIADFLTLFPELYVNSRFFIFPLWDVKQERSDRTVYPSIMKYSSLLRRMEFLLPGYDENFIEEYMELILNAQNKIWSIAIPDDTNDVLFSILDQHPTYNDYSTQVAGWKYMEAATQEFAGKLMRCFAVMNGETVSNEFYTSYLGSQEFLCFTSGTAEYLVLTKHSYNELVVL